MKELSNQIEENLKELRLNSMLCNYKELSEKATNAKLQYEEYLALLLQEEVKERKEKSGNAKIVKAKFPFLKTIEEFDFSFQPNLKEKEIIKLSSLDFIEEKSNIIFLGPPGVGKTSLAIGLGIKCCLSNYRVLFTSVQGLMDELALSQAENTLLDKLLYYSRLHLLIIDELGYMPISKEKANLLFQLISIRYEKGSIILTSNYNFDEWGKVFDDSIIASAIIDRLVHHSKIFYINGSSYRLRDKLKRDNIQA